MEIKPYTGEIRYGRGRTNGTLSALAAALVAVRDSGQPVVIEGVKTEVARKRIRQNIRAAGAQHRLSVSLGWTPEGDVVIRKVADLVPTEDAPVEEKPVEAPEFKEAAEAAEVEAPKPRPRKQAAK